MSVRTSPAKSVSVTFAPDCIIAWLDSGFATFCFVVVFALSPLNIDKCSPRLR